MAIFLRNLFYTSCLIVLLHLYPASASEMDYGGLRRVFGEPVTASATGKPQRASEAPVALEIITAEQIKHTGLTTIPEILNTLTGITNWQASRVGMDVGIRGQNVPYNSSLLVLLNGRQVYLDEFGYTDWSLIPVQLQEIQQIEVVKGPAAALYGFNAASGVINIITYHPRYDNKSEVGGIVGTGSFYRPYAFKTLKLSDKAAVRVSGSREWSNEFDLRSKTTYPLPRSAFREENTADKLLVDSDISLANDMQLRLEGAYSTSVHTDPTNTYFGIPVDKQFTSGKATLTKDSDLGLLEANFYVNDITNTFSGAYRTKNKNRIIVAQLQDLFKWGAHHNFRLQTEYRQNRFSGQTVSPQAELTYDVIAGGGMWNWAVADNVEITNAFRADYLQLEREGPLLAPVPYPSNQAFDRELAAYSFNSGVNWKVTPKDTFRASYGRGLQLPSMVTFGLFGVATFGNFIITGNPDLKPTLMQNYEVGYERKVSEINGKLTGAVFYNTIKDISALAKSFTFFPPGTTVSMAGNVGNSQMAGIELGAKGDFSDAWKWDIGYIYQNSVDDVIGNNSVSSRFPFRYENSVPHHVVKAHLGYAKDSWTADIFSEFASEFDALQTLGVAYLTVDMEGYYTLGGRVGYTFDNDITVAVSGSNLQTARTASSYGLETERVLYLQVSKPF